MSHIFDYLGVLAVLLLLVLSGVGYLVQQHAMRVKAQKAHERAQQIARLESLIWRAKAYPHTSCLNAVTLERQLAELRAQDDQSSTV